MASGYALPSNGHGKHAHFPSLNGMPYEHFTPEAPQQLGGFQSNGFAHKGHTGHTHTHSQSSPAKGRMRGESDLGRPANVTVPAPHTHHHHHHHKEGDEHDHHHHGSSHAFSISEALTAVLIPAQYIVASAAFSSSSMADLTFPPLAAYSRTKESSDISQATQNTNSSALVQACTFTSGTLLLVGVLAQIRSSERAQDRRKKTDTDLIAHASGLISVHAMQKMGRSLLSIVLPFYAALQLGGMRVGILSLAASASGMLGGSAQQLPLQQKFMSNVGGIAIIFLCALTDILGLTLSTSLTNISYGYIALILSIYVTSIHVPSSGHGSGLSAVSPLVSSPSDIRNTLVAGLVSAVFTILVSTILKSSPTISMSGVLGTTLATALSAWLILYGQPGSLMSGRKIGLALGCLVSAGSSFLFSPNIWPASFVNGGLAALSFVGVLYDSSSATSSQFSLSAHDDHDHVHTGHSHADHDHHHHNHSHSHTPTDVSAFTSLLLSRVKQGSLLYDILCEKDSRRIAYFTCLNFAFMLVQAFYGYISGSLGLLSDTVHMFFDCLALLVGLAAAVASKWPTSLAKPYGWNKLNVLAGFGNGIFLMLVSIEFIYEAIEGLMEGSALRHVEELLIVSTLGLLVNMVGLLCFGHAGHDHGSGGHSHDSHAGHDHQNHNHNHDHTHDHNHNHDNHHHDSGHRHSESELHHHTPSSSRPQSPRKTSLYPLPPTTEPDPPVHAHTDNENMRGLYLHILADAGGSLAVILSTAMNLWRPWYVWDPLAAILIALLIFAAAVPLVQESGKKLLLIIPDKAEWDLKNTLQELSSIRGVTGYARPRFWVEEKGAGGGHHHHGHSHGDEHEGEETRLMGVITIFAARIASNEDVRERVCQFFTEKHMDVVVQVEQNN